MQKPQTIKCAYIDFDSFFASVEEQARPSLRGRPIGVTPFAHATHTCVIAANRKAKQAGVKNVMPVSEARRVCPDIVLVPQSPDLYVRAHRAFLLAIEQELPVDAICSIDELSCRLDEAAQQNPQELAARIKARLRQKLGPYITCSIGMAPNRQLAKIASDMDKPNGVTILKPEDLPGRLLDLELGELPGIGKRMRTRLNIAGIGSVEDLWHASPKHLRALWGNVNGERFWYALHGYEIEADVTQRQMFGHGRVLPPEWRDLGHAWQCAKLLAIKAARRLRRAKLLARRFGLWVHMRDDSWSGEFHLDYASDDQACIAALGQLWQRMKQEIPQGAKIIRLHVAMFNLVPLDQLQLDLFAPDRSERMKWEKLSTAMDRINTRYAKTLVSLGPWTQPPGGYAGGKIAYSRVPDMEDFW